MRLSTSLFLALNIIPITLAILADDAYYTDYHYELLGLPQQHATFFYPPRKDEKATLLYTFSDLGVIGAVNPGNGKIVWRQAIYGNGEAFLKSIDGEGVIVSGLGSRVDCWDAISGISKWNQIFSGTLRGLEIIETLVKGKPTKNVLLLFEEEGTSVLKLLDGDSGDIIWKYTDTSSDVPWRISTNSEDIFLISLLEAKDSFNLRVTILNPESGRKWDDYTLTDNKDIRSSDDIINIRGHSAVPILAWTDKAKKNLKVNILTKTGVYSDTLPLELTDSKIQKVNLFAPDIFKLQPHFLVYTESAESNKAMVYHIDLDHRNITKAYELPRLDGKGAVCISYEGSNVIFTRISQNEITIMSSVSNKLLGSWPLKTDNKNFLYAFSEVIRRSGDSYAVRSAALTANEDFIMVRNGVESWIRFEGLSGAVAAGWADIPETTNLAATLYAEAHSSFIQAYIHRVNRHLRDLRFLPNYLKNLPRRIIGSIIPNQLANKPLGLVRDKFGFNKLVLVTTLRGSIYALESNNQGSIAWYLKAFDKSVDSEWDVKGIWADNTNGVVHIRAAGGEFLLLNSSTGHVIEQTESSSSSIKSTAVVESDEGRWLLPIGLDGLPSVVPPNLVPKGFLVTQRDDGQIQGVSFEGEDGASPVISWNFQPESGHRVINVISRPTNDPVASIGRVLGDRNVLYKYLNQNSILVTTVSDQAYSASFYLLDAASGDILYSTTHENVDTEQPISSALTENWFVYSLWSDVVSDSSENPSSKGYQIIISELFESEFPNDRGPMGSSGNFSSLNPSNEPNPEPALPYVVTQSFLIPEPISHMAVTQTRQGITSRQLICTLAHSNAIIGIPRTLLDPRRPVGRAPNSLEVEEELFQYQPFIEFNPNMIITHEREVVGAKGIIATPALLESTSLLFAYGIDLFGTRVTPSLAFDILGKGFNKLSLIATIFALTIGVGVLAPIARRKQINGIWKNS